MKAFLVPGVLFAACLMAMPAATAQSWYMKDESVLFILKPATAGSSPVGTRFVEELIASRDMQTYSRTMQEYNCAERKRRDSTRMMYRADGAFIGSEITAGSTWTAVVPDSNGQLMMDVACFGDTSRVTQLDRDERQAIADFLAGRW